MKDPRLAVPSRSVLHVVSSLEVGGMEQFVVRLATAQRRRNLAAHILAIRPGGCLLDQAEREGVPVWTLHRTSRVRRVLKSIALAARHRFTIAHAHNFTALHYALLLKMCGASVVLTYHGEGKGHGRRVADAELRRTDAFVAVSEAAALPLRRLLGDRRAYVVRNGLPQVLCPQDRTSARAALGLRAGVIACCVGRIDGLKGHDTLLIAAAELERRGIDVLTLIVGDGSKKEEYERFAVELGLADDRVQFVGQRLDVSTFLAASDFFVLPSLAEGLPLSVLEAMGHGLPVVATKVGGVPELVCEGKSGLLVEPNTPIQLADAMQRMAQDSGLRNKFGSEGALTVTARFSIDQTVSEYDDLYTKLLSGEGAL